MADTLAKYERIDKDIQSEEGSADYARGWQQMVREGMKKEDLATRIADTRTALEAATQEQKAAVQGAVVQERARVEARDLTNKAISDIYRVDPRYMNRDLGDAVRAIQDKFEQTGRTRRADMTDERLSELDAVHKGLNESLDRSPYIDMEKLKDIAHTPIRDLSAGDILKVRDAVKNLEHIQRNRDQIDANGRLVQREALENDTVPRIKGMKLNAQEMATGEPTLWTAIKKMWRNLKSHAGVLANSYGYNGELDIRRKGERGLPYRCRKRAGG